VLSTDQEAEGSSKVVIATARRLTSSAWTLQTEVDAYESAGISDPALTWLAHEMRAEVTVRLTLSGSE
jgi:hypothetical protein